MKLVKKVIFAVLMTVGLSATAQANPLYRSIFPEYWGYCQSLADESLDELAVLGETRAELNASVATLEVITAYANLYPALRVLLPQAEARFAVAYEAYMNSIYAFQDAIAPYYGANCTMFGSHYIEANGMGMNIQ